MMNIKTIKKVSFRILILLVLVNLLTLWWLDNEIKQFWGAHTEQVDHSQFAVPQQQFAIADVSVLSPDGNNMISHQSVLIKDGFIAAMGDELEWPEGAKIINGQGKYLIPGLFDSHVHLWQSPNDLLLYLANGITHIRELNGSDEHLKWREEIQNGRPGPDMFVATGRFNSNGAFKGWFDEWTAKVTSVNHVDEIEPLMSGLTSLGYDAIKIYTMLSNEHFRTANQVAAESGINIMGHIPINLGLEEIWASEMQELAHVEELVKALSREFGGYNEDNADEFLRFVKFRSEQVAVQMISQNIAIVSTLALMESFATQKADLSPLLKQVPLAYVNPGISEATIPAIRTMGWLPDVNIYRLSDDYPAKDLPGNRKYWETYAAANRIILRQLARQGVKVMAGTDANIPIMVPGFSLHSELIAMVQAGLSPTQVLHAATAIPAERMNVLSGRISTGYQADLLVLNANPLEDIGNTQKIEMVINNGRIYTRAMLDDMLMSVKSANDKSRKKDISQYTD